MMMKKAYSARYYEILEERRNLPVWMQKEEFLKTFKENQIVMLVGETGCGKTTQIPQFVLEAIADENPNPNPSKWVVGCTQPRRVAAISAARRVAQEMGVEIGQEVGYSVGFEDRSSPQTVLKYLTDGMLLREAAADPLLERYKVIVLDDVHERSLATNLLSGILKKALISRPDLKLVVMSQSATPWFHKDFFRSEPPLITVPGRLHPVEILYTPQPAMDYLEAAIRKAIQIHMCEPPGDVLVFLTGAEEIRVACRRISRSLGDQVKVVPLYSSFLTPAMQHMIFDPAPHPAVRKIVVAEASLAIDGIVYVVDPGVSRQKVYYPPTGLESLLVSPISKACAEQRAGRAGRARPGKCFRLYTEQNFSDLSESRVPEICRSNLENTVLILKRLLGHVNLLSFEVVDPPHPESFMWALNDLCYLGAIDDEGNLTELGEEMSLEVLSLNLL
ncbi:unnamed protein product [Microthlaspi erraticum]|uniref:RNA helicase n=1 Tax=Microthlaspi erraticum TaxID=1685480 RepID=A0A6D2KGN5_9BRAS|nr:unnamed protein product [Microthlaspi erraticum]CAA7051022.1 unnamed protein product [Microthlaspi erraticum]